MKKTFRKIRKHFFTYFAYFRSGKNREVFKALIFGIVKLNRNTKIGTNSSFNGCTIYGNGNVSFGDNFHSAKGLVMLTTYHNHNGEKLPYDETVIHKDIRIEDNVWLGMNVMILGGVTIGEGAIIQAGSVVVNDIPKYAIAGGAPAKVFSQRNVEKYERLKSENKFI